MLRTLLLIILLQANLYALDVTYKDQQFLVSEGKYKQQYTLKHRQHKLFDTNFNGHAVKDLLSLKNTSNQEMPDLLLVKGLIKKIGKLEGEIENELQGLGYDELGIMYIFSYTRVMNFDETPVELHSKLREFHFLNTLLDSLS